MTATIVGTSALSLDQSGTTKWEKSPATLYQAASTVKLLTALVAYENITDLDELVTVTSGDMAAPVLLQAGDTLSYRDLFHLLLLRSENPAAQCIARTVGAKMGGNYDTFTAAMEAKGTALGWTGHVITTAWGGGYDNRLSAVHLTDLIEHIRTECPWVFGVAGTLAHTVTITGGRSTTIPIAHSFNPAGTPAFPEFLAGKSGTNRLGADAPAFMVIAWTNPNDNTVHTTAIMNSIPAERPYDLRAVMDDVIAATARRRRGGSVVGLL